MSDLETRPDPPQFEGLTSLLMQTSDLYAIFDADDRLLAANPAYCAAYNCDPATHPVWHQIMRANFRNARGPVIETDDIEDWLTNACARRFNLPFRSFEAELHGGKWIWVTETVTSEGRMLFHASDISSLRTSSRNLRLERDAARRASWTDALTGIPNRRYVMDRLEEWHSVQNRLPQFGEHSLAVVDLDRFKELNDTYGHEFGDDVLVSFCRDVVSRIRPFDLFGRIGGEEFLFFMPNCALDVAQERLETLQRTIRQLPARSTELPVSYSFSAGLVLVRSDRDIHHAMRRADRLLYQAKHEGRGRVLS